MLSLTTAQSAPATLRASVRVNTPFASGTVIAFTLKVTSCSFISGCSFLGYGGAGNNPWRYWTNIMSVGLARSMIAHGADVNEQGTKPLFWIARDNTAEALLVASVLMAAGADANTRSYRSDQPLHHAAEYNSNPDMIHVLVQGGADINGIHAWALTPLDFSNRYGGRLRDSLHSVIAALRFRGGKCRSACRAGDIHLAAVSFSPAVVTVTTSGRAVAGNLYTVQAARGLGTLFNYRVVSTSPAGLSSFSMVSVDVNSAILSLNATLGLGFYSVYIEVTDNPSGDKATLRYELLLSEALSFSPGLVELTTVLDGNLGTLIYSQLRTSVGEVKNAFGDVTYIVSSVNNAGDAGAGKNDNDEIYWNPLPTTAQTLSVYIEATDESDQIATLTLSIAVHNPLLAGLSDVSTKVTTAYTGRVASITTSGGGGANTYTVIFGDGNFTVGADGIISLTAVHNSYTLLTANVVVDDGYVDITPAVTVGYTLIVVAPCSFFTGCQPAVNFDGAGLRYDVRTDWMALSAPLARSLIAAGADVNERMFDEDLHHGYFYEYINVPPLLMVTRHGTPAVASVLLANGADVNATGEYVFGSYAYSDFGAIWTIWKNLSVHDAPLASLFVAYGADVNLQLETNGVPGATPLDNFNRRDRPTAALIIKAAGAKCLKSCESGDIRLSAVSFAPAVVTVTTSGRAVAGNLYTVQAASGLGTLFNYRVVSTSPAGLSSFSMVSVDVNSALLSLNAPLRLGVYSVYIEATDNPSGDKATLTVIFKLLYTPPGNNLINKVTTRYQYDAHGNLKETQDAHGNVISLFYDKRGRKTKMSDPDMGVWTYGYDGLDRLTSQVDGKGQTMHMHYDKLGRVTLREEPSLTVVNTYDTAARGIGKLASTRAGNDYARHQFYDSYGRPILSSVGLDSSYAISVTYDAAGRIHSRHWPTGFAVTMSYNPRGYLERLSGGGVTLWEAEGMDALGNLTGYRYGNGVATTLEYDVLGRMTRSKAGLGNIVQNKRYAYDYLGNLTMRKDINLGHREEFSYDNLNRLVESRLSGLNSGWTGIAGANTQRVEYDALGNITYKSDVGYYIYGNERPHAVSQVLGATFSGNYSYDANGNQTQGPGRAISYTSFNKVSELSVQPASYISVIMSSTATGTVAVNTITVHPGLKHYSYQYGSEHQRVKEIGRTAIATTSIRKGAGFSMKK